MTINSPETLAELTRLHDRYEEALSANDTAALTAFFWDSPHVVRYGVHAQEHLYGAEQIEAYRLRTQPTFSERRIRRRVITTFGGEMATIMCEIEQRVNGALRLTRQAQTWLHLPGFGWKIVAAHVSSPLGEPDSSWTAYAAVAAARIGLPLTPEECATVGQHLARAGDIAQSLLAFFVPDTVERAPVFTA